MKKYFLLTTTEGCATNLLENTAHRKRYESLGYEAAADADSADLIFINTCAYSGEMENRAIDTITEIQNKYAGKEVVLSGCLPKINPARTKEVFRGSIVESPRIAPEVTDSYHGFEKKDFERLSFKHRFVLKLRPLYFDIERFFKVQFQPLHNIFNSVVVNEKFYLLTVASGCVGQCTFCAIKRSKGKLISRPLSTVLTEFEMGLKKGYRDFWLLGDDIGCWGQDLGLSVADLLKNMLKRPESFSIVLNYLDPHFMLRYRDELGDVLADSRIICINVPLQSASQSVLARMKRHYQVKELYDFMRAVKSKNPGLAIKTNIMVGFPGETWLDFMKSLLAVFHFDALLAMKYSPRPHTSAERFEDQVSIRVKKLRFAFINFAILVRHIFVALASLVRLKKDDRSSLEGAVDGQVLNESAH